MWSDEFNTESALLDTESPVSLWTFNSYMSGCSDLILSDTSDVATVTTDSNGNGVLRLTAYKTADGVYKTVKSVSTGEKMTFVYGYLEMRARISIGQGVWPSFWLKSNTSEGGETLAEKLGYNKNSEYHTEVDVFEVFGGNCVIPNLHKWWKPESQYYSQTAKRDMYNGAFLLNGEMVEPPLSSVEYDISDGDWHIYGMLWTPEKISMYVDGVCYMIYDLTVSFGRGDMAGFHEPLCIIINNHLFTPGYVATDSGKWALNYCLDADCFSESVYDIDYIRLYQDPDFGKIYFVQ